MAAKDTLFRLIRSLSQSEKGYFKKHASLYSGSRDNNYIRLFEAIDKQKEYDEVKLKKQFKNERFTNNFSAAKNYLLDVILRALKSFHGNRSNVQKIQTQINDAKMLFKKGLFEESQRLLDKARESAAAAEEFIPLLDILSEQMILILQNAWKRDLNEVMEIIHEKEKVGKQLSNLNGILLLYYELFDMRLQFLDLKPIDMDRIEQIIQHPLLKSADQAMSLKAKGHFFLTHQYYADLKGDPVGAREFARKYLSLLHENPDFTKRRDAQNLMFGLYNYLNKCRDTGFYDDFPLIMEQLQEVKPEYLALKVLHFEMLSEVQLTNAFYSRDLENIDLIIENILLGLKEMDKQIRKFFQQSLYYFICIIRIIQGRFKEALDFNLLIMEMEKDKEVRADYSLAARTLNLILHLELGNHLLIPSLSRSLSYHLKKEELPLNIENSLINHLNKVAQSPEKDGITHLNKYLIQIKELSDTEESERRLIQHFDIKVWLQSKIEKVSMEEIYLKEKQSRKASKQA